MFKLLVNQQTHVPVIGKQGDLVEVKALTKFPAHIQMQFSLAKMGQQLIETNTGIQFWCIVRKATVDGNPALELQLFTIQLDTPLKMKNKNQMMSIWIDPKTEAILEQKVYE